MNKRFTVLKFGGASFEKLTAFTEIAQMIARRLIVPEEKLIVVVSAMKSTTDQLIAMATSVAPNPEPREKDMLVSVGERISASLLSIALNEHGFKTKSFTGSQAGVITDASHENARILRVQPHRLEKSFEEGMQVAVVAGFQGVSQGGEITTLGRGGTDVTAVALAIAMKSECVEFYKDVSGIYDKDPKIHSDAVHFPFLSYEQAHEIALKGAKVLHPRAIELAKKNSIPLLVQNFSCNDTCTWVGDRDLHLNTDTPCAVREFVFYE